MTFSTKPLMINHLSPKSHTHTRTHTQWEESVTCATWLIKIIKSFFFCVFFYPLFLGRCCEKKLHIMTNMHVNISKKVPIEQIICARLVMLWQRPTVEKSTKQIQFCVLKKMSHRSGSPSVCLDQYLQVKCSFYPCILKQSMHLHHYIQTSWCLCDSAWSCHHTYIYNIFTYTIYISTWTRS